MQTAVSLREVLAANLVRLCQSEQSIATVCRSTKINRQQFNRYLSGCSVPNYRNREKICSYFGISESELFREPPAGAPSGTRADAADEARSLACANSTLKKLNKHPPTSVEPGLYYAHFAYPPDPGTILRATVVVGRDGNLSTFRRLTGFAEPRGSWWSHYRGDHKGIILERRHWLYFTGLNSATSQEPTLLVLRWTPDADPVFGGFAMILTPDGPMVTAVVLSACRPGLTLRAALKVSHAYSVNDSRIEPFVLDLLEQQCQRLSAMVRHLDLSVTPGFPPQSDA